MTGRESSLLHTLIQQKRRAMHGEMSFAVPCIHTPYARFRACLVAGEGFEPTTKGL